MKRRMFLSTILMTLVLLISVTTATFAWYSVTVNTSKAQVTLATAKNNNAGASVSYSAQVYKLNGNTTNLLMKALNAKGEVVSPSASDFDHYAFYLDEENAVSTAEFLPTVNSKFTGSSYFTVEGTTTTDTTWKGNLATAQANMVPGSFQSWVKVSEAVALKDTYKKVLDKNSPNAQINASNISQYYVYSGTPTAVSGKTDEFTETGVSAATADLLTPVYEFELVTTPTLAAFNAGEYYSDNTGAGTLASGFFTDFYDSGAYKDGKQLYTRVTKYQSSQDLYASKQNYDTNGFKYYQDGGAGDNYSCIHFTITMEKSNNESTTSTYSLRLTATTPSLGAMATGNWDYMYFISDNGKTKTTNDSFENVGKPMYMGATQYIYGNFTQPNSSQTALTVDLYIWLNGTKVTDAVTPGSTNFAIELITGSTDHATAMKNAAVDNYHLVDYDTWSSNGKVDLVPNN